MKYEGGEVRIITSIVGTMIRCRGKEGAPM